MILIDIGVFQRIYEILRLRKGYGRDKTPTMQAIYIIFDKCVTKNLKFRNGGLVKRCIAINDIFVQKIKELRL